MTEQKLNRAIQEAVRFIEKAEKAMNRLGPIESAKARRASKALTRSLADLRR